MNTLLLIFFALPIAVIIVSIALQRILKCPILVAAIIFAIFLVVTFSVSDLNFLVATIIFTIISYITAVIVCFICRFLRDRDLNCFSCRYSKGRDSDCCNCRNSREGNDSNNELLRISSNCQSFNNLNSVNSCNCSNDNNNNNTVSARISVIPNDNSNGRIGTFSGSYRRRC